jgi:hypothetical protein
MEAIVLDDVTRRLRACRELVPRTSAANQCRETSEIQL